jgi:hypothetical protein
MVAAPASDAVRRSAGLQPAFDKRTRKAGYKPALRARQCEISGLKATNEYPCLKLRLDTIRRTGYANTAVDHDL